MTAFETWVCRRMAALALLFGQREAALRYLGRILAANPQDAESIAAVGYQYAQAGRKSEALAFFDRLVLLQPDNAEAHFNRGFLLQERTDHDGAMASFRRVLELNPQHDRALYGLGLSLIATRRLEEAIAPLRKNTKLQPMSPYGWYQLARVEFELGHRDEAQKILDHLQRFEPKVAGQLERETGLKVTPT